jgi:tetratricopeptide (TPR) repeat protein
MSPEQADGDTDALGPASDVYSLGAMLYAILTGRAPFEGSDPVDTLRRVRAGGCLPPRAVNATVPAALDAVCRKAMARAPADRYAGALALAADVQHWLADEPVAAHREPWSARARRWGRRHRTFVTGAAAAVLVAAAAAAVAAVFLSRAYDRERDAKTNAEQNERQAEEQRDLARRNFRRARDTVDRLLTRVGENLADTPQAEELRRKLLEDALEFQEQFLADDATDPVVREEAAAAAERVGLINWRLGRAEESEKAYRLAIDRYDRLAADFPDEPRFGRERVSNYNFLGTLLYGVGRVAEADALWQKALALHEALPADNPVQHAHTLAKLVNNRANLLRGEGRWKDAEAGYRRAIAVETRLAVEDPDDPDHLYDLTIQYNNLSRVIGADGRPDEAITAAREGVRIARELCGRYPTHALYRDALADDLFRLGNAAHDDDVPAAVAALTEARERYEALRDDFPYTAGYSHSLGVTLNNLALLERGRGRTAEAVPLLEAAVAAQRRAAALNPKNPELLEQLRKHYANLFDTLVVRKEYARAAAAATTAAELYPRVVPLQVAAARCLAGCVPAGGNHADEAVKLVRRAVAAGYEDYEHLLEDDAWQALRERADFRKIVEDLGESVRLRELAEAERRVKEHDDDPDAHDALAQRLNNMGVWYRLLRRSDDGVNLYRRSLVVYDRLTREHPTHTGYALNHGGTHCNLAHLLGDAGRDAEALAEYGKAVAVLEPLLADESARATARRFLRNTYFGRAGLRAERGWYPPAVADFDRALTFCDADDREPIRRARVDALARAGDYARAVAEADDFAKAADASPAETYNLACVYALSADAARAASGRPRLEGLLLGERYAAQAVAMLGRVAAAGHFADPAAKDHMAKDADLDGLRRRGDYRRFVESLK